MNKEKQVQIPESLFIELVKHFCLDVEDNKQAITKALNNKLDAIIKHDLYTKFKTAATDAEKEEARQQYLEKIGIHQDFVY